MADGAQIGPSTDEWDGKERLCVGTDGRLMLWNGVGWIPGENVLRNAGIALVESGVTADAGCEVAGIGVDVLRKGWDWLYAWGCRQLDLMHAGAAQPELGREIAEPLKAALLALLDPRKR